MTNAEAAELRGEIFGLKIILNNCLAFIAALTDNPEHHLDEIQNEAIAGIAKATNQSVRPQHIQTFRAAAAGLVLQSVEAAKAIDVPIPPRERLQ
jgi:hypothetical protein